MSLTISWEPLDKLIASGLEDLAILHWEEAEIDKEDVPLDVDFERARAFEKSGHHFTAALRSGNELVGYAAFTVMTAMFHRGALHAYCHAIYVEPERRGFASLWLLRWIESALTDKGVRKLYIAAKTQAQCDLFKKLGYSFSEASYSKILGARHEFGKSTGSLPAA